jgi:hypothetical protein
MQSVSNPSNHLAYPRVIGNPFSFVWGFVNTIRSPERGGKARASNPPDDGCRNRDLPQVNITSTLSWCSSGQQQGDSPFRECCNLMWGTHYCHSRSGARSSRRSSTDVKHDVRPHAITCSRDGRRGSMLITPTVYVLNRGELAGGKIVKE